MGTPQIGKTLRRLADGGEKMDVYNEVLQISSEETKDKTFIPLEGTITTASKERY
jgi:hypothetical protein